MRLIHHVSKNLILNQGCSQKCHNNENIHVDSNKTVYECQRVECAFTSPVRTECGMFVMYCMQCCMSVSAVL